MDCILTCGGHTFKIKTELEVRGIELHLFSLENISYLDRGSRRRSCITSSNYHRKSSEQQEKIRGVAQRILAERNGELPRPENKAGEPYKYPRGPNGY